jgi:hypothetical protein
MLLALGLGGLGTLAGSGCGNTKCGEGTIEVSGVCLSGTGDGGFSTVQCDLSVSKLEGGRCIPKEPIIKCETGDLTFDDAGIGHCIGSSTMGTDCTTELTCDSPSGPGGDTICMAGRVVDGATKMLIDKALVPKIEVRIYEPLGFLADTTTPAFRTLKMNGASLGTGDGLDECGRYRTHFSTSQDTPNGLVAIAATGLAGSASASDFILGASANRPQPNTNILHQLTFLVSKTQDQAWSSQAGLTGGMTFASLGTLAIRFHTPEADTNAAIPGMPVAGITPKWQNTVDTNKDHFFSDTDVNAILNINETLTKTGANGTSFITIGKGIGNAGAVDGAGGCTKAGGGPGTLTITGAPLAGSANGVIFFFNLEVTCT